MRRPAAPSPSAIAVIADCGSPLFKASNPFFYFEIH